MKVGQLMAGRTREGSDSTQGAAASLLNGLGVLEAFSIQRPILGVTEIATQVGLHKSTVSRILAGLSAAGYVERDESTGRFRLGLGVIGLSGPLLAELDVRRVAHPSLERLTDLTEETSALAVWNGDEAVVVEQIPSPRNVKHTATIGTRYQKFESSSVRTFLAELPESTVTQLIDSKRITRSPHSGLDGPVAEHLAKVRQQGYAINEGFTEPEEFGVSVPVHDYRGVVVGCITASAPRSRITTELATTISSQVSAVAQEVSARLGAVREEADRPPATGRVRAAEASK